MKARRWAPWPTSRVTGGWPRSSSASADASPRVHRQAFLYVVGTDRMAEPADVTLLDTIRRQWEVFFRGATEGRMRVETRLRAGRSPL